MQILIWILNCLGFNQSQINQELIVENRDAIFSYYEENTAAVEDKFRPAQIASFEELMERYGSNSQSTGN